MNKINKNQTTILVLGISGMLGHKMFQVLSRYKQYDVYGTVRDRTSIKDLAQDDSKIFESAAAIGNNKIFEIISEIKPNVVINCIGITKQKKDNNDLTVMIYLNSIFPHRLAKTCSENNARLITISTDCVFDGQKGASYIETEEPTCHDAYGMTKFLGEINYDNHLTLRTSIIGHELHTNVSLLDWFISSKEAKVSGYTDAIFSGFTTLELSKIIAEKIIPNKELRGLYQISVNAISKYDLLNIVKKIYNKEVDIVPDGSLKINRALDSTNIRKLINYTPPGWEKLISDMHEDYQNLTIYKNNL